MHASELVREAEIDVVPEPRFVCAVMLNRVERLHDVVPASLPVLGRFRQVLQVDQQVLRPILYVLLGCRPVRVLADPFADVVRIRAFARVSC